jgi:DNA-binding MarR family transcriptional regulator
MVKAPKPNTASRRGASSSESAEPDYTTLLAFREALRRFSHWTEDEARAIGVTPAQHQLMLCVGGTPDERGPTIREVADSLILRHHSAVELVDRAVLAGLVKRHADSQDARTTRVRLTPKGSRLLRALSLRHQDEVRRLAALLQPFLSEA